MTDKSENRIQSEIMIELSKRGHKVWRSKLKKNTLIGVLHFLDMIFY